MQTTPQRPHVSRTAPDHATTVARVDLACGAFDALRAVGFAQRFPPHFHETFAIGVVERGSATLRTLRGTWVARPGTILAFSPGEIHAAEAREGHGYSYRMLYPGRGIPARDWRRGRARGRTARALSKVGSARVADVEIVERARRYLCTRFGERVRLAAVAARCGVSEFHLIRIFRRAVGVTPYAYLVQLRVNRAQAMLCRGAAVADVAYSCGFSDQSHLTRTFRKAIGMPPGAYVRSMRRSAA